MPSTPVNALTNIGNIQDGDCFVGERTPGQTVTITFNGVVYDADFTTNGFMCRTSAANYANRTMTGTLNRLSITDGDGVSGNPTFDIDTNYVGQSTITTLGTVSTGTWQASIVGMTYGGTGANLTPSDGGLVYSTGTAMAVLSGTATAGQIPRSGANSAPSWSTATFASTYGASELLYSNGANNVVGLTTGNNSLLVTNSSGVPSWGTDIPTAVTIGGGAIYRSGGTDVSVVDGGTGRSTATAYAVICGGTTDTGAHQSIASVGTAGQVLKSNGASALPSFQKEGFTTAFKARLSTSQTVTPGVATKMQCSVEEYDTGGWYNTTNYRYTPQIAGKYRFVLWGYGTTNAANGQISVLLYKNGSEIARQFIWFADSGAQVRGSLTFDDLANGSTDYYEMYCLLNGTTINNAIFMGNLIEGD